MSKTIITAKANSVLLATVLVAGIIALSYPSFMIGAQAQEFNGMDQRYNNYEPEHETDYGMDSYDKKSYEKDYSYDKSKDSVKNIESKNYNFNGLKPHGMSSGLNGLSSEALAADEGANGASSSESDRGSYGGSSGHDGSVTVYCIFDNHKKTPKSPVPPVPVDECTTCFTAEGVTLVFPKQVPATLPMTDGVINSFEELCNLIFNPPYSESLTQLERLVEAVVPTGTTADQIDNIVDCLVLLLDIRGGGNGGG